MDDRFYKSGAVLIRDVLPATDTELARVLLRVQCAVYAVEAALIQADRIPPLHEDLDDLHQASLRWLVAVIDEEVRGAPAWKEGADQIDIDWLTGAGRPALRHWSGPGQ